jgi:hypothetical protein
MSYRARLTDGAYVITSISLGERSLLTVRISSSTIELWAVEGGHIQHKRSATTRDELAAIFEDWKPWLANEAPPEEALN